MQCRSSGLLGITIGVNTKLVDLFVPLVFNCRPRARLARRYSLPIFTQAETLTNSFTARGHSNRWIVPTEADTPASLRCISSAPPLSSRFAFHLFASSRRCRQCASIVSKTPRTRRPLGHRLIRIFSQRILRYFLNRTLLRVERSP